MVEFGRSHRSARPNTTVTRCTSREHNGKADLLGSDCHKEKKTEEGRPHMKLFLSSRNLTRYPGQLQSVLVCRDFRARREVSHKERSSCTGTWNRYQTDRPHNSSVRVDLRNMATTCGLDGCRNHAGLDCWSTLCKKYNPTHQVTKNVLQSQRIDNVVSHNNRGTSGGSCRCRLPMT